MNENATTTTLRRHEKYDRLIAAVTNIHLESIALEHFLEPEQNVGVVLHDENFRFH